MVDMLTELLTNEHVYSLKAEINTENTIRLIKSKSKIIHKWTK